MLARYFNNLGYNLTIPYYTGTVSLDVVDVFVLSIIYQISIQSSCLLTLSQQVLETREAWSLFFHEN
jgi:hypothetical protein